MKKKIVAALVICLLAVSPVIASTVDIFGMKVNIPSGWRMTKGEQVLIYDSSETAVVIVDQVNGTSVESVAENLASAVGVRPHQIKKIPGGCMFHFVQNGEQGTARVISGRGCVLMIYAFGRNADRVAGSIGR